MDIAALGLSVDATQPLQAAEALDKLDAAGKRVDASTTSMTAAVKVSNGQMADTKRFMDAAAQAQRDAATATSGLGAATSQLTIGQQQFIDKLRDQAAMAGMSRTKILELQAAELGLTDVTKGLIGQIDAASKAHNTHTFSMSSSLAKMESMRVIHDAMIGSYSRMGSSLFVLGNATGVTTALFTGMGLALGAVIGVVAAVGYAMTKGASEQRAMNDALIMTGNYAGQTGDSLNALAHAAVATGGSLGDAKKVVTELAASGKFTGDQIGVVADAVISLEHATGASVEKTIKQFESLAVETTGHMTRASDTISRATVKLDDEYHFLTVAVYDQIRALEQEGKIKEASALATTTFADATKERSEQMVGSLGYVSRAWNSIKEAIGGASDAIGNWGKKSGGNDIAGMEAKLMQTNARTGQYVVQDSPTVGRGGAILGMDRTNLIAQITAAQIEMNKANKAANDLSVETIKQSDGVHAAQRVDALLMTAQKKSQGELTIALKEYHDEIAKVRAANPGDDRTKPEAIAAGDAAIIKSHSVRSAATKETISDYDRLTKSLNEQIAQNELALTSDDKLSSGQKLAAKIMEDLRFGTITLTAAQATQIGKSLEQILTDEKAIAARKELQQADLAAAEAHVKLIETLQSGLDKTQADIEKQKDANAQIGLSVDAIAALTSAKADQEARTLELLAIKTLDKNLDQSQYDLYIAQAKAIRDLDAARSSGAAMKAAKATADAAESAWAASDKKIEDGLYTAISNGGETAVKKLIKDMKEWFARLVLSPIISPIAAAGASLLNPTAGNAASSAGSAGSSMLSSAAGSAGSSFLGASFATTSGASFAGIASGSTYGTAALSQQSLMLAAQETTGVVSSAASAASSLSSLAATAAPYVLAAVAAYALFKAVNGGETRGGGQYAYSFDGTIDNNRRGTTAAAASGTVGLLEGPSGGELQSDAVKTSISATVGSINAYLKGFGSSASLAGFQAGIETSKEGRGGVFAGGNLSTGAQFGASGAGDNYAGTLYDKAFSNSPDANKAIADFATELKQTTIQALQAANIGGAVGEYLNSVGDIKSLSDTQAAAVLQTLNDMQALAAALKLLPFENLKNASYASVTAIAALTGGMTALGTKLGSYYTNFYSQSEQSAHTLAGVSSALATVNLALPTTREGFRALVDAQDLTSVAGQTAYAALINVADSFASVVPAAQDAATAIDGAAAALVQAAADAKTQRSLDIELMTALGNAEGALSAQRADALSVLTASQQVTQKAIYAAQDASAKVSKAQTDIDSARSVLTTAYQNESSALQTTITKFQQFSDTLKAFQASLLVGALSPLTGAQQAGQAASQFAITNASAKAGNATAMAALQGVSQTYLTALQSQSATAQDYAREFAQVNNALSDTADTADHQVSVAQRQLDMLNQAVSGILENVNATISVRDALAAYFTAGGTKVGGTGGAGPGGAGTGSSNPAGDAFLSDVAAYGAAQGPNAYYFAPGLNDFAAKSESAANIAGLLGISTGDAFQLATGHSEGYWAEAQRQFDAGQAPTTDSIKGFAGGGFHSGGLRIVGENGPELESTGPSRIFNASQTKDMLNGGSSSDELKALREEMRAANIAIAQTNAQTAKILARWESDGLPTTRTLT